MCERPINGVAMAAVKYRNSSLTVASSSQKHASGILARSTLSCALSGEGSCRAGSSWAGISTRRAKPSRVLMCLPGEIHVWAGRPRLCTREAGPPYAGVNIKSYVRVRQNTWRSYQGCVWFIRGRWVEWEKLLGFFLTYRRRQIDRAASFRKFEIRGIFTRLQTM